MKKLINTSLKTKKIIAREILIFIISIIVPTMIFLGLHIHSSLERQSLEKQLKQTESLIADYKNSPKYLNRDFFCNAYAQFIKSKNISIGEVAITKAWNRLVYLAKSDSIEYKWNNEWEDELIEFNKRQGFQTARDFTKFIIDNSPTQNEINKYNEIIAEKWDLESKISKINDENNLKIAKTSFYVSLLVLFLLRYVWYLINWCVKIIRL